MNIPIRFKRPFQLSYSETDQNLGYRFKPRLSISSEEDWLHFCKISDWIRRYKKPCWQNSILLFWSFSWLLCIFGSLRLIRGRWRPLSKFILKFQTDFDFSGHFFRNRTLPIESRLIRKRASLRKWVTSGIVHFGKWFTSEMGEFENKWHRNRLLRQFLTSKMSHLEIGNFENQPIFEVTHFRNWNFSKGYISKWSIFRSGQFSKISFFGVTFIRSVRYLILIILICRVYFI